MERKPSATLLIGRVSDLRRGKVGQLVAKRIREFKLLGRLPSASAVFRELCFCILTANFNAERAIKIQSALGNGLLTLLPAQLARRLKALGHRYPNSRANYICKARLRRKEISATLRSMADQQHLRDWVAKEIVGLGYKEASHFLRNVGFDDLAIVDFHILDLLARNGLFMEKSLRKL